MNCQKCKVEKPDSEFVKNDTRCKPCLKIKSQNYAHSKLGVVSHIYSSHKRVNTARGHGLLSYKKFELADWLFGNELFHTLFNTWGESGFDRFLKPSCDRIDENKGYSFDNLELKTFRENCNEAYKVARSGDREKWKETIYSPVVQLSMDDVQISVFKSINIASRETGVAQQNISKVCRGKRTHAGGFKWRYVNVNSSTN